MEYNFSEIEEKWKKYWVEHQTYKVYNDTGLPKYYVLDMFPYPSGAALHVGHPLGYVASDIYARYKRMKGFNVLHPMGFDAFGLPAEQYAIETGAHPADTTQKAIEKFRSQMDKIGFSFDWSRAVTTCDPHYYKWTQWIFLKLFSSWYNREKQKADPIDTLIQKFEKDGCRKKSPLYREGIDEFEPGQWSKKSVQEQQRVLMHYRLAFLSYAEVNWCPALGTVLANDEVKDGRSERGGHPVERKKMRQWFLRITEYSDRLLEGLQHLDWSEPLKDMQRNWIGRSEGAIVKFRVLTPNPSPKERGIRRTDGPLGYMTGKAETSKENLSRALEMRRTPTEAEAKLWNALRNQQTGHKFRRQYLIDRFIVDFVCLPKGLVIEVDGTSHELTQVEDAERTAVLNEFGFKVIRFSNDEVINRLYKVLKDIHGELAKIKEDLTPLKIKQDWIRSQSESVDSPLLGRGAGGEESLEIFTTRPDTIFGATFMVVAPEHELLDSLITAEQKQEVENYLHYVRSRSDVERQQEKKVTGAFTGSFAINPFTNTEVPIYTAEYVLAGYGTGAIMAVPADDERDRKFAEKFGLSIVDIIDKSMYPGAGIEDKVGKMINSGGLNGMEVKDAIKKIIGEIENRGIGQRKVNYKQHDAGFSRQRYWGEPFPIRYKVVGKPDSHFEEGGEHDDIAEPLNESQLPLLLPEVSSYKPTGDGRSPLANNKEWLANNYETDTMPGYAGSSWYFLRYMDSDNASEFASKESLNYWQNVDVYFGGAEHAVGHLLYARLWHKVLYDLGYVPTEEPFKKVVNQGMIQGVSRFIYRGSIRPDIYVSAGMAEKDWPAKLLNDLGLKSPTDIGAVSELHVPLRLVKDGALDIEAFKKSRPDYADAKFVLDENGQYICGSGVEKMSKSKLNTVDPTEVIQKYGADCFRLYEMFLGPIELSKPWDEKGITGVQNFLRKFWRLFYDENGWKVKDETPIDAELKILHKTLKKVTEDIERFNYNTCVSSFMIAVNELSHLGSSKKQILEPLLLALSPLAPFITEELWENLGHKESIHKAKFPMADEKYLIETVHQYGVSINGKVRAQIELPLDIAEAEARTQVMQLENIRKWTNGGEPKKFIFIKGKIINIVI